MLRLMYLGILFVMIVLVFAAATVIRRRDDAVSKSISSLFLMIRRIRQKHTWHHQYGGC